MQQKIYKSQIPPDACHILLPFFAQTSCDNKNRTPFMAESD